MYRQKRKYRKYQVQHLSSVEEEYREIAAQARF